MLDFVLAADASTKQSPPLRLLIAALCAPVFREWIMLKKTLILITVSLITQNLLAEETCELSPEYLAERGQVALEVYGEENSYGECKEAAFSNEYWKAVAKCINAGDGENVAGSCFHLVGRGKYKEEPSIVHCEAFVFEPSPELAQEILNERVEEKRIIKCKN